MDQATANSVEQALKLNKPMPLDCFYFGILFVNSTVVQIFRSKSTTIVRPADIIVLQTFLIEHDLRLKKRAPCFFNMCIPGLTESYKMSVFYHTNNTQRGNSLKLVILTEEASAALVDKFEAIAENLFKSLIVDSTATKLRMFEE